MMLTMKYAPGDKVEHKSGAGPAMVVERFENERVVCAWFNHAGTLKRHAFVPAMLQVFVGKDLADAVEFQLALGPAGEVYREAGKLGEEQRDEIAQALTAQLAKYQQPSGVLMDSSSWKVTAKNPA
jgi:uncharacterized protein YodC (DUF2158 family)